MKKIALAFVLAAVVCTALISCKKSQAATEPILSVETTPANKSNNLNVLGPDFPVRVEITSGMPANGVRIDITANTEGAAMPFFTSSTTHTEAPQNNYIITGTPDGVTCVVSIMVTSLTKTSNVWKGEYRYSKK
ncbi:MAG: hypothetical protein ABIU63_07080 [Chitinophagaceae bacterium]